jgi:CxxC motif-containing protein
MKKELICISCPIGCGLLVEWDTPENISVSGNRCPRGEIYGSEEARAPSRMVTATVAIESDKLSRLPVKTDKPIGKEHIPSLLQELYSLKLLPPVGCGDIILDDFAESGVSILATRTIEA